MLEPWNQYAKLRGTKMYSNNNFSIQEGSVHVLL